MADLEISLGIEWYLLSDRTDVYSLHYWFRHICIDINRIDAFVTRAYLQCQTQTNYIVRNNNIINPIIYNLWPHYRMIVRLMKQIASLTVARRQHLG